MRTTLTLDDDVAARIERLRRERRTGLRELVNAALRSGLDRMEEKRPKQPPYRMKTWRGNPVDTDLDNIAEVIARYEGEDHR
jgi:hypothetical protein